MVFCLSVMLGILLPNIHKLGHRSVENFLYYQNSTQAHNIAVSGANLAVNQIYLNNGWRTGYSDVAFAGGTYDVETQDFGINQVRVVSVATYQGLHDTVAVVLQPASFAQYAYYSQVEGAITWITGDTVWGPFHTQAVMKISGKPVFKGRVSAKGGTNPKKSTAIFDGGYVVGEDIVLPTDLSTTINAGIGGRIFSGSDVWFDFSGTSVSWKTSSSGPVTVSTLSTFAPNGVILVAGGNIHIQGVLSGKLTLCATGGAGEGSVYVDDDMRYSVDPRNATSNDMLGLVCDNSVIITDNAANNNSVILQASIFCRTGGLTAEHYNSRPVSGTLNLFGGVTQYQRGAVGTFSGGGTPTISTGFRKSYVYDDRLNLDSPPFYPLTGGYQLVSWHE